MNTRELQSFPIIPPDWSHRAAATFLLGLIGFIGLAGPLAVAQDLPISQIADLMATPRDQAALRNRVRIRGTVSLVGDGIAARGPNRNAKNSFCVEDSSAGIWVRSAYAVSEGILTSDPEVLLQLDLGVEIEMEGLLDRGGFAPVIVPSQITILGTRELPEAPPAVMSRFLNGADELRRVKVDGVVQNIVSELDQRWSLRVETGVGHFVTRLPKQEQFSPTRLLDAKVEMTGLAAVVWNWRSEFVCPRLIISREEDVRVLEAAPKDAFSVEKIPLESLDGYTPLGRPLHRRLIEGTVTYYDGYLSLYVQEENIGIYVEVNEPESIEVGDRVEVSGFIDTSRYLAGLRGAFVRRLGRAEEPVPVPITVADIVEQHQSSKTGIPKATRSCDGQLIQISGRLLSFEHGTAPDPHRMEVDCGDSVITAYLAGETTEPLPGTELQLTGIANLLFVAPVATARLARPNHVDLLMRDANDIVILRHPSWWTAQRTFAVLTIVAGLAVSVLIWAGSLRRTLSRRTDQLATEMRSRRDAAIEFQGAIGERTRLAANLHDTLLQTMAGIAYQIEACGQSGGSEGNGFQSHLDTASRMVQRGQDDLRNTVWALHCLPLDEGTFAESVREVVRKISMGTDANITVQCADDFPVLADFIAGNLLLVIQEAMHNAIKHANATCIEVELKVASETDCVDVSVTDNGSGFDPNTRPTSSDGHFGIEGMIQRIERLGGTLMIESEQGLGTSIRMNVPIRAFDPKIA